ncbi:hypothetical protein VF21_01937 [Pseudogymnoascus sp. 05NY08]|nr:hypothetical protein VF21_01937 [Pseudogymnoascus sp. 05NY08]
MFVSKIATGVPAKTEEIVAYMERLAQTAPGVEDAVAILRAPQASAQHRDSLRRLLLAHRASAHTPAIRDELRSKLEGLRDSKDLGEKLQEWQRRISELERQVEAHENVRLDLATANRGPSSQSIEEAEQSSSTGSER